MRKTGVAFLFTVTTLLFASSCSITKRHYFSGFHVAGKGNSAKAEAKANPANRTTETNEEDSEADDPFNELPASQEIVNETASSENLHIENPHEGKAPEISLIKPTTRKKVNTYEIKPPFERAHSTASSASLLFSTISLIFGVFSFIALILIFSGVPMLIALISAVIAITTGAIGKGMAKEGEQGDKALSIAGMVLGIVTIALLMLYFIFLIIIIAAFLGL